MSDGKNYWRKQINGNIILAPITLEIPRKLALFLSQGILFISEVEIDDYIDVGLNTIGGGSGGQSMIGMRSGSGHHAS